MSDGAAPAPPPAAAATEPAPVETKAPEVEPSDEYEIDGKRVSLTRTQAKTFIQKGAAADKRFKEAADAKAKHEDWLKLFEEDPEEALRKAGKDPDSLFSKHFERKAKQALLTPEQREAAELKEKLAAHEKAQKQREKEQKEKEDAELDERNQADITERLLVAADKYGLARDADILDDLLGVGIELCDLFHDPKLPEDKQKYPSMDQIVQEHLRREGEHFEKRDAKYVSHLKGDKLKAYLKANAAALTKLPAADLLEVLGPDGVKAFNAATLTKLPTPGAPRAPPVVAPPPRNGAGQFTRHITEGEFNKRFGR